MCLHVLFAVDGLFLILSKRFSCAPLVLQELEKEVLGDARAGVALAPSERLESPSHAETAAEEQANEFEAPVAGLQLEEAAAAEQEEDDVAPAPLLAG